MNQQDLPPEIVKAVPGAIGALVSLTWIHGTWPRKAWMFFAGAVLAGYGTSTLADWTKLNPGFAGFLLGLLGMAVADKAMTSWLTLDAAALASEWLRKVLGLPPKQPPAGP